MKYKFKEKDNVVNILDGDNIIARYSIDYHWQEKNISIKENTICVRLYNRMKGYADCEVKLNIDDIQYIPQK